MIPKFEYVQKVKTVLPPLGLIEWEEAGPQSRARITALGFEVIQVMLMLYIEQFTLKFGHEAKEAFERFMEELERIEDAAIN